MLGFEDILHREIVDFDVDLDICHRASPRFDEILTVA
jgi:hypothetical protein